MSNCLSLVVSLIFALHVFAKAESLSDPLEEANKLIQQLKSTSDKYIQSTKETLNKNNDIHKNRASQCIEDTKDVYEQVMEIQVKEGIAYWKDQADEAGVNVDECLYGTTEQIEYIRQKDFEEDMQDIKLSIDAADLIVNEGIKSAENVSKTINDLIKQLDVCAETTCYIKIATKANELLASLPGIFKEINAKAAESFKIAGERFEECDVMESSTFFRDIFQIVFIIASCIRSKLQ